MVKTIRLTATALSVSHPRFIAKPLSFPQDATDCRASVFITGPEYARIRDNPYMSYLNGKRGKVNNPHPSPWELMLRAALGADVGKACQSRLLTQVSWNGAWLWCGEATGRRSGADAGDIRIQTFNE